MRRTLWLWLFASLTAASPALAPAEQAGSDPELQRGVEQVAEGDFDGGVRTLGAVIKRYRAGGGSARDLSRAQLYLGIAHLGLRSEAAAKQAFLEALKADPGLTLSADEFPPRVIAAVDQVRRELPRPSPSVAASATPAPKPSPSAVTAKVSPVVFLEASKAGDFVAVRTLLNDDPSVLNAKDEQFGATALHWAALRGHQAVVALLIERGADASLKNKAGETPLVVAERAKREDVVRLLGGSRPAAGAASPIFDAAKSGDAAAVQKLLDADPSLLNRADTAFGATALHWAALRGHEDVARVLLQRGADPSLKNGNGETALQVAERANRAAVVQVLKSGGKTPAATAPPPVASGAAPSAAPRPTASPVAASSGEPVYSPALVDAVKAGQLVRVRALLEENPARVNGKDAQFGATPLHWAALRGHAAVAELLVASGADVNARNGAGETPLQVAQRSGRADVVRVLSKSGS
jgi:ankyrin repeat protein